MSLLTELGLLRSSGFYYKDVAPIGASRDATLSSSTPGSARREGLKDLHAGPRRWWKRGIAMFASLAIDGSQATAARTEFTAGPLLHCQKCQEARQAKQEMKKRPTERGRERKAVPTAQPEAQ